MNCKRRLLLGVLSFAIACFSTGAQGFDWLENDPQRPPESLIFPRLQTSELIPEIMGHTADPEWRESSITAFAWFMWKTRDGAVGPQWRAKLRALIFAKLRHSRNKHDLALLAGYLGLLDARAQILDLLHQIQGLDCCYGPALVRALGACGEREDIPFLIGTLDRESESSGGISHEALVKLAHFDPIPNDRWPYDREKLKRVWGAWWKANASTRQR